MSSKRWLDQNFFCNVRDNSKKGGSELSLASAPELALTFAGLKRDVLFQENVLEFLVQ
jgi:hypothetical protein